MKSTSNPSGAVAKTRLACGAAGALLALLTPQWASAQVTLVAGSQNMFRDTRADNDVGLSQGDRFQFGAEVVGGSVADFIRAVDLTTGFTTSFAACDPLAVDANFCASTTPFSAARLADNWQIQLRDPTGLITTVAAPSVAAAATPIGFPGSVTISGGGATPLQPTLAWTLPAGYTPDAIRVNVYDKSVKTGGQADIIESATLPGTTTSFTVPAVLNSTSHIVLNGNYTLGLQLITSRPGSPAIPANPDFLERSSSFFDFSPTSGGPPSISLPTILSSGVYSFSVSGVGPATTTFIDPAVAVGFVYAIGAGDPNFRSVVLPNVGGGTFVLKYVSGGASLSTALTHDTVFFFPGAGVASFEVDGIDPAAAVDPTNGGAFVTGLTFAANGSFTGTMTPLTVAVPEPATALLWLCGTAGVALRRRLQKRHRAG